MRFVDTNVLLYAISTDASEERKATVANQILDDGDVGLSVQVLQEFYVQVTRASRSDALTHGQAVGLVESFMRFPTQVIDVPIMLAACATKDAFGISYWDAAIIEASRALGCEEVLSEDMSHHQDYAGIRIVNPFAAA